jgi:iron complex transport system ATP-binding protein
MTALEAKKIQFFYNTFPVIDGISLSLNQGEFLGIIGPNGAGKSTMLRLLSGILKPKNGSVELFGINMSTQSHKTIARNIAFVPQETHFALNFTVEEIVSMGRYPYQRPFHHEDQEDRSAVGNALKVTNATDLRARTINSLSSGERQLVVVARSLAQSPKILLLDEPTSHLDLYHQHAIMELLERLNKEGISIAVVHHDLNLASLYCQNLILIHRGKVYAEGEPNELLNRRILKEVYGTDVTIVRHPEKNVPQIFLHTKGDHEDNNEKN